MKEILEKISSYNLFNNLLPGILYVILISEYSNISLVQDDILVGFFLYYFIGLVISRIGSLVVEPVLKKLQILKFAKYSDFLSASTKDLKIETLLESNNMYRTIIALLLTLMVSKLYLNISEIYEWNKNIDLYVINTSLLVVFILAYRKQTWYIKKRVEHNIKN